MLSKFLTYDAEFLFIFICLCKKYVFTNLFFEFEFYYS